MDGSWATAIKEDLQNIQGQHPEASHISHWSRKNVLFLFSAMPPTKQVKLLLFSVFFVDPCRAPYCLQEGKNAKRARKCPTWFDPDKLLKPTLSYWHKYCYLSHLFVYSKGSSLRRQILSTAGLPKPTTPWKTEECGKVLSEICKSPKKGKHLFFYFPA